MKTLVIGANGQLGTDIVRAFEGMDVIPLTHADIEITDPASISAAVSKYAPDVIINTAAFDNVPESEKRSEKAFHVNADGVKLLAGICNEAGITLLQISTDYVFDGSKREPYTEEDLPAPLNVYGASKARGELFASSIEKHYIVRVSGIYGITGCRGKGGRNFVESILKLAAGNSPLKVSSNIITSPTYTLDAACEIRRILVERLPYGIYHVANSGLCSWHEFAREILALGGISKDIEAVEELAEAAGVKRPLYSPLISIRVEPMRPWKEALAAYMKERETTN